MLYPGNYGFVPWRRPSPARRRPRPLADVDEAAAPIEEAIARARG
jgi:hypothetical protein